MLGFDNTQIDPPKNWQDFEVLCRDVWAKVWKDKNTQMNGRSGQNQQGVDIYGRINGDGDWCGVQCKGKDSRYGSELTKEELQTEVNKAKSFSPKLKQYTIATTAKSDANIQKIARELSDQHAALGLFSVHVESWDEICHRMQKYSDLIEVHYPGRGLTFEGIRENSEKSLEVLHRIDGKLDQINYSMIQRRGQDSPMISCSAIVKEEDYDLKSIVVEREIDSYKELIDVSPRSALVSYQRLKGKYWNSISDNMRFRIITNIGASHLELGEYSEAAECFIKANSFSTRDNTKAIRNHAYGFLLRGNFIAAKDIISEAIGMDSNDPENYVIYIASLAGIGGDIKFEDLVPEKHLDHTEVIFAIGNAYHECGNREKSFLYIERAYNIDSDSVRFCAAYGTLLLENAVAGCSLTLDCYMHEDNIAKVKEAKTMFDFVWSRIQKTDSKNRYTWVALNLCISNYILKCNDELELLIKQLEVGGCTEITFFRIAALYKLRMGHLDKSLLYLNNIQEGQSVDIDIFRVQIYIEMREFAVAFEKLRQIKVQDESIYSSDVRNLRVNLIREISGVSSALDEARKNVDQFPEDTLSIANLASLYAASNEMDLAKSTASIASEKAAKFFDAHGAVSVADILYDLDLYDQAQVVYKRLLKNYHDSHILRRYILCLYQNDARYELLDLFDKIDDGSMHVDFYLFHMAAVQVKIGDYNKALNYLSEYLAIHPDDLSVRLNWIYMKRLIGQHKDIVNFLDEDKKFFSKKINDSIRYAIVLAQYGHTERGRKLLYGLLRLNQSDFDANIGYIQFMFMFKNDRPLKHDKILENSAVTLEYDNGNTCVFIIEADNLDKIYPEELAVGNAIAKSLLGKKVGDTVEYSLNEYNKRKCKIACIEDKYSYVCRKVMQTVEESFPNNKLFGTIELTKEGENYDFSPLFNMIKKQHDKTRSITDIYIDELVPVSFVAYALRANPFEVWNTFSSDDSISIKCFGGSYEEITKSRNNLQNDFVGFMIDPLSLFFIHSLKVHDLIVKNFGKLGITQSTLDFYRAYIEKYKSDESTGSLRKHGDRFVYLDYTKDDLLQYANTYEVILDWTVENCVLIPAVTSKKPVEKLLDLKETIGDSFYDTLLAASGSGRVLLSEDLAYRCLAKQGLNIDSVWLQVVLLQMFFQKSISFSTYAKLIEDITLKNIKHVVFDSATLLQIVINNQWQLNDNILKVFSSFGGKDINILYSLIISLKFTTTILRYGEPIYDTRKFVYLVLNTLIKNNNENTGEIIGAFFDLVNVFPVKFGLIYKQLLTEWCVGHFMQPVVD